MKIRPVNMEFLYGTAFLSQSPEAYERLITDAMRGDATLFTRNDEVEAQWRICDPIVKAWARDEGGAPPLADYEAGSQGPEEANGLLREGDRWRAI
jgi:glucose-6-phosphate 1-dehydrogenase